MSPGTGRNVLYELAQIMVGREDYPTAIALRKLARTGYSSLDEVESASDWTLLSISGIGMERLRVVRRLTRPDWQPPSPEAAKAAAHFVAAARFALRFWPQEILAALIEGSVPEVAVDQPHESRWAMELFSTAVGEALCHHRPEALIGILNAESCGLDQTASSQVESS